MYKIIMVRSGNEEQQIRAAAESILGSSSSYPPPHQHECSINSVRSDVMPPGDLVTGARIGGRMSVVRRFFCLFVTFDLLFTVLMWLICIMLVGKDVFEMLSEQIVHYNIHTSLFDVVMAAAARFLILLLFYALLYINHWCVIALTTAGTCSFLIAKVFVYNWLSASSPVLQVLLIITSFVIAWGEAWFLDFRVIPHETQAEDFVRSGSYGPNERTPLLHPYLQSLARTDDNPDSVRNFYSPLDSPAGSDDEEGCSADKKRTVDKARVVQSIESQAQEVLTSAWRMLGSADWRLEKSGPEGDTVHSRQRPRGGKLYRLEGYVDMLPEQLLQLLFHDVESFPTWNPTLTEARRLEVVDEHTDVSYQVMAEGGGGLVASRDFVTLRCWEKRGTVLVLAYASTTHAEAPVPGRLVRGEQGPSCWVLQPQSSGCLLRWLLDTDLRGWLPQALLDQAYAGAMLAWMGHLRAHACALLGGPSRAGEPAPET